MPLFTVVATHEVTVRRSAIVELVAKSSEAAIASAKRRHADGLLNWSDDSTDQDEPTRFNIVPSDKACEAAVRAAVPTASDDRSVSTEARSVILCVAKGCQGVLTGGTSGQSFCGRTGRSIKL